MNKYVKSRFLKELKENPLFRDIVEELLFSYKVPLSAKKFRQIKHKVFNCPCFNEFEKEVIIEVLNNDIVLLIIKD
jgi:hypothetical protein